jgi:hypothetical protein
MLVGMLTVPGCCCWFSSLPLAIAGLVMGIVALQRIQGDPQTWKGQALAICGIVCSAIGIVLALLAILTPWDEAARSRLGIPA